MTITELTTPPISALLARKDIDIDRDAGTLRASFEGGDTFLNPAGNVAGGMLSAMLDDLTASLVDALSPSGVGVTTVSLNVAFLRPARPGKIEGSATSVRQGRELCHVNGMLRQDGKDVAWAVAICKLVKR